MSENDSDSPQAIPSAPSIPLQGSSGEQAPLEVSSYPKPIGPKRPRGRPRSTSLPTEQQMERGGLGLKVRKALNKELRKRGIEDGDLPIQLRDVVAARSRKGKAGQIVVRALSGVQKNGAATLARRLEHELSGGRDDVIEKLQASGSTNQSLAKVVSLLQTHPGFSLARAIAEAGADVANVLDSYAKGALALKKLETVLALYEQMPHLMKDLARHAVDKEEVCGTCLGVGLVQARAGGTSLSAPCPTCKGEKKVFTSSNHKEYAASKLMEMSEFLPKKTGLSLNVNQGVQVVAGGKGDLLARMSKAADEILYGQPRLPEGEPEGAGEVVDAEEV